MNRPPTRIVPSLRLDRTRGATRALPPEQAIFLEQLVCMGLVEAADRDGFMLDRLDRLREYSTNERLGFALMQANLLTEYQLDRVLAGLTHGLMLGNYRVLEEIGRGGMGTVYLAEHRMMKRRVAVKVVPCAEEVHISIRQRFHGEMRILAELYHPNIVLALDAGEVPGEGREPGLIYMVLELVEGGDLERIVTRQGVCNVIQACSYIRQAAAGLQAAHDRHLIHRDIKPSNLLLSATGQIKLVDFGLTRQFSSRLTDPRALLGSIEFMPPEQSHDPSSVGKEADIYGLGATLFWLLTGEGPFPYSPYPGRALRQLQETPPRRLRSMRPDVPVELDELVSRMLDRNPANRPSSGLAVANALRPFLGDGISAKRSARGGAPSSGEVSLPRLLAVGPQASGLARLVLEQIGCECGEARDGRAALEAATRYPCDLVLLALRPGSNDGEEICRRLRDLGNNQHLKILVVWDGDAPRHEPLPRGADDWMSLPFEPAELVRRVRVALAMKSAQDRSAHLADQLLAANSLLEQNVHARQTDLDAAHDALLFAMAKVAESRDGETPGHLERMKGYCRILAEEAAKLSPWQGLVDDRFLRQLERCVPLHDIGKIGLPDEILLKPASLTPEERALVQTHPIIGDQILESLASQYGAGLPFLGTARVIVRHHHERWDGTGYPDRLYNDATPPAARLVAVADVYDALRRMRMYKPAMSHNAAVGLMLTRSPGQFDPSLLAALERCHPLFERLYREIGE